MVALSFLRFIETFATVVRRGTSTGLVCLLIYFFGLHVCAAVQNPQLVPEFWHGGVVSRLAFSSDDTYLISIDSNVEVKKWDVNSGALLENVTLSDRAWKTGGGALSTDAEILVQAGGTRGVHITSLSDGKETTFQACGSATGVGVSSPSHFIACGESDGHISIRTLSGRLLETFPCISFSERDPQFTLFQIVFSSDEKQVAAIYNGGVVPAQRKICVHDRITGSSHETTIGRGDLLENISFDNAGTGLVVACSSFVKILSASDMHEKYAWNRPHPLKVVPITAILSAAPLGSDEVIVGANDGLFLWNYVAGTHKPLKQSCGSGACGNPTALSVSHKGNWVVDATSLSEGNTGSVLELRKAVDLQELKVLGSQPKDIVTSALSPDGTRLGVVTRIGCCTGGETVGADKTAKTFVQVWNLRTGALDYDALFRGEGAPESLSLSSDGQTVALGGQTGVRVLRQGVAIVLDGGNDPSSEVLFATKSNILLSASDTHLDLWTYTTSGRYSKVRKVFFTDPSLHLRFLDVCSNGKLIAFTVSDWITRSELNVWDIANEKRLLSKQFPQGLGYADVLFNADCTRLAVAIDNKAIIVNVESGSTYNSIEIPQKGITSLSSGGGDTLIAFVNNQASAWSYRSGLPISSPFTAALSKIADNQPNMFINNARPLISISNQKSFAITHDGAQLQLWDLDLGALLCTLVNGGWPIVAPDGRFDTNSMGFEQSTGLHWRFADEPSHPLPLEIFMRGYYEPRLLPRLLGGKPPLPLIDSVAEVNRNQPIIGKMVVTRQNDHPRLATISVNVASHLGHCLKGDDHVTCESGVYDLRLYRDGQLVSQSPSPASVGEKGTDKPAEQLQRWREVSRVKDENGQPITVASGEREIVFRDIRLPQRPGVSEVKFTVYGFNEDRVKSGTTPPVVLALHTTEHRIRRRAYVITMGVDVTSDPNWRLSFAPTGAQAVEKLLKEKLPSTYEPILIPLISGYDKSILVDHATKGNLHAVLNILSGVGTESQRKLFPLLSAATPDDLVVLYIASHGYADPSGTFYVIPSDIGEPAGISEELLNRCLTGGGQGSTCSDGREFLRHSISSDELTLWIQRIDAGEMVLILDSCHSAAITGPEFKPGPMGDRGFGQLSYDKRMRVLAATQSDSFAWGTLALGDRSLLTVSLTQQTPDKQALDLGRWLSRAVELVPELYKHYIPNEQDRQDPALFDFAQRSLVR